MTVIMGRLNGEWGASIANDELWAIGSGPTPWAALAAVMVEVERLWLTNDHGPNGSFHGFGE